MTTFADVFSVNDTEVKLPFNDECGFIVRPWDNKEHKEKQARVKKQFQIKSHSDPERIRRANTESAVGTVITGWYGWKDNDGNDVEFSEKDCVAILMQYPRVMDQIWSETNETGENSIFGSASAEDLGKESEVVPLTKSSTTSK